jgi:hypothetical protein
MRYYRKLIAFLVILIVPILPVNSQHNELFKKHSGDIGIGTGIDYGGFGIQVNQFLGPVCFIGGYGFNYIYYMPFGGIKYYILPKNTDNIFAPYLKVIYGCNAVIIIKYGPKDFYYGFTPGIGTNVRFGRIKSVGFNLDINIPIRTKKFNKAFDNYKMLYGNFEKTIFSFPISFGFQIALD